MTTIGYLAGLVAALGLFCVGYLVGHRRRSGVSEMAQQMAKKEIAEADAAAEAEKRDAESLTLAEYWRKLCGRK